MYRRKIIIFEGMDSVGKDTQIKFVCNKYKYTYFHILHYCAVTTRSNAEARRMSHDTYLEMLCLLEQLYHYDFILNRSHYGEYVYGKIYRNYEDPDYVLKMEKDIRWRALLHDATLITLVNSNFDELIKRDDGNSLSACKRELLSEEYNRFLDVHEQSIIKAKKLIDVNGLSIEQVSSEINSFLDEVYLDEVDEE